jgi:hypothetical protein
MFERRWGQLYHWEKSSLIKIRKLIRESIDVNGKDALFLRAAIKRLNPIQTAGIASINPSHEDR